MYTYHVDVLEGPIVLVNLTEKINNLFFVEKEGVTYARVLVCPPDQLTGKVLPRLTDSTTTETHYCAQVIQKWTINFIEVPPTHVSSLKGFVLFHLVLVH